MFYTEIGLLPTQELEQIRAQSQVVIQRIKEALFESNIDTMLGRDWFPATSLLKRVRDGQYEKMKQLPVLMVLGPGVTRGEIKEIRLVREMGLLKGRDDLTDSLKIERYGRVELTVGISDAKEGAWVFDATEKQIKVSQLQKLKPNAEINYLGILLRKERLGHDSNLVLTRAHVFPVSLPKEALKAFCGKDGWLISLEEFREKVREAKQK